MMMDTDVSTTPEAKAIRHIKSFSWQRTAVDLVRTGDAYGQDTVDALVTLGVPADAIICDTKRKPALLRVQGEEACAVMQRLGVVPSYWQNKVALPAEPALTR